MSGILTLCLVHALLLFFTCLLFARRRNGASRAESLPKAGDDGVSPESSRGSVKQSCQWPVTVLAAATSDGSVILLDPGTGVELLRVSACVHPSSANPRGFADEPPTVVAVSPDGEQLAVSGNDGRWFLFDSVSMHPGAMAIERV